MVDMMQVFLSFNPTQMAEMEQIIEKMDDILKECGWENTGFMNMYTPAEGIDGDDTWHDAQQAVLNAEFLKTYSPRFATAQLTDACDLNQIVIDIEGPVSEEKMKRYSEYCEKNKKYVHGILVDENNVLLDGYITYLLAKNGGVKPDIMQVRAGQIFKKAVRGRLLNQTDKGFECTDNRGVWYYDIEPAVVPGDVVRAGTEDEFREVRVDSVFYLAGKYDCGRFESVTEHLNCTI